MKLLRIYPLQSEFFDPNRTVGAIIYAEGLQTGDQVSVGGTLYPLVFESSENARFVFPALAVGVYPVFLFRSAIEFSNTLLVPVSISAGKRVRQRLFDQRSFLLDAPVSMRTDSQRVLAGSQFNGAIPNEEQGLLGDPTGPTQGGRWAYNRDVLIRNIEFMSNGTEPAARSVGSGLFIKRGNEKTLLLDLATIDHSVSLRDETILLKKGEILLIETVGATLEMKASLVVERYINQ